ncbi:hypothetical protein IFR05_004071 [Cadophora sp. M221]|nr:hypothetical protein IFR05_004071 [Cadophora sp. M221]
MIPAVFVLPDSLRWMAKVGMIADARIVLRSLHAGEDLSDAAVESGLQAIIDAHAEDSILSRRLSSIACPPVNTATFSTGKGSVKKY